MGTDEEPGIIPLTVKEIFKQIELNTDREFLIRIGYIEIYNEKIYDLLVENKTETCKVQETMSGEVVVNQTEIVSSSIEHILECYDKGNRGRRVGETCMNVSINHKLIFKQIFNLIFFIICLMNRNGLVDHIHFLE